MASPPGPRLKVCATCLQVSFVRGDGRGRLRCRRPLPESGKACGSREVQAFTIDGLNELWRRLRSDLSGLRSDVANLHGRLEEAEEVAADLRIEVRAQAGRLKDLEEIVDILRQRRG